MPRMTLELGPFVFRSYEYDPHADVLYVHEGEPRLGQNDYETPEGHKVCYTDDHRLSNIALIGPRRALARHGCVTITIPYIVHYTVELTPSQLAPVLMDP